MTNTRREILAELNKLTDLAPDIRIGQLVAHLGFLSEDDGGHGLGDIEDAEMLKVIERHREELARLSSHAPNQPLHQSGAL